MKKIAFSRTALSNAFSTSDNIAIGSKSSCNRVAWVSNSLNSCL